MDFSVELLLREREGLERVSRLSSRVSLSSFSEVRLLRLRVGRLLAVLLDAAAGLARPSIELRSSPRSTMPSPFSSTSGVEPLTFFLSSLLSLPSPSSSYFLSIPSTKEEYRPVIERVDFLELLLLLLVLEFFELLEDLPRKSREPSRERLSF